MPVNFQIDNHVIMPFGCKKWDINQIKVTGVSSDATYFMSKTKCAYIDKSKNEALRLSMFPNFFPTGKSGFPNIEDVGEVFKFINQTIQSSCMVETKHERKFLNIYFEYIVNSGEEYTRENVDFFAWWEQRHIEELSYMGLQRVEKLMLLLNLMPFPQAHLYVDDPFAESQSYSPNRMLRVDFAFWTGKKIVAVEIDGSSHIGSLKHIEKDRLLLRSGIEVIHILNSEIDKYGTELIKKVLPEEIVNIDYIPHIKSLGLDSVYREDRRGNSILNPFSKW